ncbi:hypothetical protein RJZ56_001205 [Blastomyces dermatitidis]|uniref:Rho-GAP domain-containing protein n=1 Tax=Ajellomyces dermatitidis (strain ATCC 18188 / CBS 674.68) TaxID=653446 RepID=F2TCP9_AJEDA|nr:hypothetical protein BDDG_03953 [Blastomyces dermatitidis ATCC 18188]
MGFSKALRWFSRRRSKHKRSNSTTSPIQTEPTISDPKHSQTSPFVTVIEPSQEDLNATDNLVSNASNQQIGESRQAQALVQAPEHQAVLDSGHPVEPVKKASTPSRSAFENLQIEKSGGRSQGSPIRICQSSNDHEDEILPASSLSSEIEDENHKSTAGLSKGKDVCLEYNQENKPNESTRQLSNETMLSDVSCATVQRNPSRYCQSPIATVDFRIPSENDSPFSDRHAIGRRPDMSGSENVLKPSGSLALVERGPSTCSSSEPHRPDTRRVPRRSSDIISNRIVSGTAVPQRDTLRSTASNRLHTSVEVLEIVLPSKSQDEATNLAEGDSLPKRSDSFLGRIRSVKSNLGLNCRNSNRRTLRRIQTFANLPRQYHIGDLNGKGLEELARLGGLSYLDLPEGYGPRKLALPTCFASTMGYLLENGIGIYDLHQKHDDNDVVRSLYSEYAHQVLSAAMRKDTIDKTTRAVRQPNALVPPLDKPSGRNMRFIHDVSTVFKHLLCGIPGGILGSVYLGKVLRQIQQHEFKTFSVIKDPHRREYRPDLPLPKAAKIRLIALALAALTSDMQLDFICAIFGLLAFTADENAKVRNAPDYNNNSFFTLPDSESLDGIFGFVLVDPSSAPLIPDENFILQDPGICYEGLVKMIIDHWKDIYVQLSWMEGF